MAVTLREGVAAFHFYGPKIGVADMTLDLVRVSKAKKAGLPFEPSTFYSWHHRGRHPEIFISFDGTLFVDRVKLQELLESRRGANSGERRRGRKRKEA